MAKNNRTVRCKNDLSVEVGRIVSETGKLNLIVELAKEGDDYFGVIRTRTYPIRSIYLGNDYLKYYKLLSDSIASGDYNLSLGDNGTLKMRLPRFDNE